MNKEEFEKLQDKVKQLEKTIEILSQRISENEPWHPADY